MQSVYSFLGKFCLVLATVLAPIKAVMITTGVLVFFDLITGIYAALKRGEKIQSAKLRATVVKLLVYQVAVISGFLVETYMLENFIPISKIVAGTIGMVELTSLFENIQSITGLDLKETLLRRLNKPKE